VKKGYYPETEAFGPIEAADLLDKNGKLSSSYVISNTIKNTLEYRGSRRALVIGRKGSGKTTLLLMSKSDTKISCVLDIGGDFPSVVNALSKEVLTKYTEPAARIWSTVVWNTIVLSSYVQLKDKIHLLSNKEHAVLKSYVQNLEACIDGKTTNKAAKFADTVSGTVNKGSVGLAAAMVTAALKNDVSIDEVITIAEKLLKLCHKKAIVLIDTMEFYGVKQGQAAKDCIRGLLNCCARIHHESEQLECRLFFPDELTQFVKTDISNSVLKDFRDVQYLRWQSSELICLAALRLRDKIGIESKPEWKMEELTYTNVRIAQGVLHNFLPVLINNTEKSQVEVLSYILRHTQSTPRQLLVILNSLASHTISTDGSNYDIKEGKLSTELIKDTVRICAQEFYTDILATYREIYPEFEKVLSRLLPRLSSVFTDDELVSVFRACEIKADYGLDFENLKFALSDIGAIGIVNDERSNEQTVYGTFSYMREQRLLLTASKRYCVHPIFSSVHEQMNKSPITVYPKGSSINNS